MYIVVNVKIYPIHGDQEGKRVQKYKKKSKKGNSSKMGNLWKYRIIKAVVCDPWV